jgi:hypothetical protein
MRWTCAGSSASSDRRFGTLGVSWRETEIVPDLSSERRPRPAGRVADSGISSRPISRAAVGRSDAVLLTGRTVAQITGSGEGSHGPGLVPASRCKFVASFLGGGRGLTGPRGSSPMKYWTDGTR